MPFPAIRWQEVTPEVAALQKKEHGDWKSLSVEEKKECIIKFSTNFHKTHFDYLSIQN
jgi:hypothetical protein